MSEVPGKFQDICDHRSALWTFVRVAGVEPTNNHAEQDWRAAHDDNHQEGFVGNAYDEIDDPLVHLYAPYP